MNWSKNPDHNNAIRQALMLQTVKAEVHEIHPVHGLFLEVGFIELYDGILTVHVAIEYRPSRRKHEVKIHRPLWKFDQANIAQGIADACLKALPSDFLPAAGPA